MPLAPRPHWLRRISGLALLLALVLLSAPATSQEDGAGEPEPVLAELREAAQRERAGLAPDDPRQSAYDELTALLVRREAERQRAAELQIVASELAALAHQTLATRIGSEPPYGVATYDEVELRLDRAARDIDDARRSLEVGREAVTAAASARNALPAAEGDPGRELEHRVAEQRLALHRELTANALRTLELAELRTEHASAEFEWVADHVEITSEEIAAANDDMDRHEAVSRRQLERAELALREAEQRWESASSVEPERRAVLRAELTLGRKAVALQSSRLTRMAQEREASRRRLAVLADLVPDRATLIAWLEDARAAAESLARERRLDEAELLELTQERAEVAERSAAPDKERVALLAALDGRIALDRADEQDLIRAERAQLRLASTLERKAGAATWGDRARELASAVLRAWQYELGVAGDSPITVGKIVLALGLIIFGLIGARLFSRGLERRVLPGFGLDRGASHAFAELAFYALLVVVFLISLQVVSIPLTVFAVAGGALAIGVGLGSQNILNNFISGIVLLAERPIKIGDLVQVDDTYGNVERIGLRSTRIRTGENIHVIVPNSTFLETNVVNWTHNDPEVRIMVGVGVAYGSPTREVEARIRAALADNGKILARPEPIVLFREFGDNALHFEMHFWVRIRAQMERLRIESDVRFAIDEQFAEAGIVIAFPQRDVHLDTLKPLEVRMVSRDADGDGS